MIYVRKTVVNRFREFADFNIIQYGHETCSPGHSIGNFVRKNYLIHYVHKGKGVFRSGGKEYELKANDAFFIYPEQITYYEADKTQPWEYSWVEFNGTGVSKYLSATTLTEETPVIINNVKAEAPIIKLTEKDTENPYELMGCLYDFLGALVTDKPKSGSMADEYVKAAISYIHTFYYHTNINVEVTM